MEIIPGIFLLKTPIVNCYLIVEDQHITLIDAGVKATFQQTVKLIQALGRQITDLTRILLTHADIDHIGSAMALKEASGARIYASQIAADALAEGRSSRSLKLGALTPLMNWFERQGNRMQVEVDEILSEGQTLPVLGGLEVIATPGHTPGHVSYYAAEDQLLFAGDAVRNRPGLVDYNRVKLTNWDHQIMQQSVHKLATLKPEIVCSGHGPVLFNAAKKFP